MSVKVENRPENRFAAFNTIETLRTKTVAALKADVALLTLAQRTFIEDQILSSLIKLRSLVCTFNSFNVFTEEYSQRRKYHIQAIHEANSFKSSLELLFVLTSNQDAKGYSEVFQALNTLQAQLKTLLANDSARHLKGAVEVRKEFQEAKKKDFYKEEHHDNTQVDPKVLDYKDPLGVTDLIYVRPEASTEMPSNEPFK